MSGMIVLLFLWKLMTKQSFKCAFTIDLSRPWLAFMVSHDSYQFACVVLTFGRRRQSGTSSAFVAVFAIVIY